MLVLIHHFHLQWEEFPLLFNRTGLLVFIHVQEMTGLLKGYDNLKDEDKSTIKKLNKVFSFYSKVNETQKGMAV